MIRDPRVVFDQLFQVTRPDLAAGGTATASRRRSQHPRTLVASARSHVCRPGSASADRLRLAEHLENVREVERRIQRVEQYATQRRATRSSPAAPARRARSLSRTRQDHVRSPAAGLRRTTSRASFAFKLGRDNSNRTYRRVALPAPSSDVPSWRAKADHRQFATLNTFHVGTSPTSSTGSSKQLKRTGISWIAPRLATDPRWATPTPQSQTGAVLSLAGHAGGTIARHGCRSRAANGRRWPTSC